MAEASEQQGYYFGLAKDLANRQISLSELADMSGVSKSTLTRIRSSQRPVNGRTIFRVIEAINRLSGQMRPESSPINFDDVYTPEDRLDLELDDQGIETEIDGVSFTDFIALALTNADTWDNKPADEEFRLLTSKEIYQYLPTLRRLAIDASIEPQRPEPFDRLRNALEDRFRSEIPSGAPSVQASGKVDVEDSFYRQVGRGSGSELDDDYRASEESLRRLFENRLIKDPFVETVGVVSIAVLGVVPTSFTKRTKEGDVVFRKVSAILWDYEYLDDDGKKTVQFHLKAEKLVQILKESVAWAHKQLNAQDD